MCHFATVLNHSAMRQVWVCSHGRWQIVRTTSIDQVTFYWISPFVAVMQSQCPAFHRGKTWFFDKKFKNQRKRIQPLLEKQWASAVPRGEESLIHDQSASERQSKKTEENESKSIGEGRVTKTWINFPFLVPLPFPLCFFFRIFFQGRFKEARGPPRRGAWSPGSSGSMVKPA